MTALLSAEPVAKPEKKSKALYDPPWKRVLLRFLKRSAKKKNDGSRPLNLWTVYRRMGWSDSQAYWKTRSGRQPFQRNMGENQRELKPTELALMAQIIGASPPTFMFAVAKETGIPEPTVYAPPPQRPLRPNPEPRRKQKHPRPTRIRIDRFDIDREIALLKPLTGNRRKRIDDYIIRNRRKP